MVIVVQLLQQTLPQQLQRLRQLLLRPTLLWLVTPTTQAIHIRTWASMDIQAYRQVILHHTVCMAHPFRECRLTRCQPRDLAHQTPVVAAAGAPVLEGKAARRREIGGGAGAAVPEHERSMRRK